jgi:S1-C subfamily serine protease
MLLILGSVAPAAADAFLDGGLAQGRHDYATALRFYHAAANQGDARAIRQIAAMYLMGEGLPHSDSEALKWYSLAAERGDSIAQSFLGSAYQDGDIVPRSYADAAKWLTLAARQGEEIAQWRLAELYLNGNGVTQNFMKAYFWSSIAAARLNLSNGNHDYGKDVAKLRNTALLYLTPEQIAEAQRQVEAFRPENIVDKTPAPPKKTEPKTSSGTAFFVSKEGDALTNAHVVEGCKRISVKGRVARLIAIDQKNDLALLGTAMTPPKWATLRPTMQLGEDVVAFGFPLSGLLTSEGNVVTGNVRALAGMREDRRYLQISAPVQPGNSGGPLLDRYGNVVGVGVMKLDALKFASVTGDIPQNVNFAIKASVAAEFLDGHGVKRSNPSQSGESLSTPAIAKFAQELAAQVICIQ